MSPCGTHLFLKSNSLIYRTPRYSRHTCAFPLHFLIGLLVILISFSRNCWTKIVPLFLKKMFLLLHLWSRIFWMLQSVRTANICKYFLPEGGFSFYSLNNVVFCFVLFRRAEVLKSDKVQLIHLFSFADHVTGVPFREKCLVQGHTICFWTFSWKFYSSLCFTYVLSWFSSKVWGWGLIE